MVFGNIRQLQTSLTALNGPRPTGNDFKLPETTEECARLFQIILKLLYTTLATPNTVLNYLILSQDSL